MSRSPTGSQALNPEQSYLDSWSELAELIQQGRSFSGRERNCAFLNTGKGKFADVSGAFGLDLIDDGRTVVMTDWDHDGDLDFWIANRTSPRLRFLRNDLAQSQKALAIRLKGNPSLKTNLDAIGARVELHLKDGKKRIQTLYGGDGFLSQSTKWLHFGIQDAEEVEKVVVRWPNKANSMETFSGIQAGTRVQLTQGSGKAQVIPSPKRSLNFQHQVAKSVPASDRARIRFAKRPNLKAISYRNLEGQAKVITTGNRVLLINLWARKCTPCVKELYEFSQDKEKLKAQGVEILALNVDDLEGVDAQAQKEAKDLITKLKLDIPVGFARTETINELQKPIQGAIYRHRQLPVPTTFLVDSQSKLALVIKGATNTQELLKEVAQLNNLDRKLSVPFEGSWSRDIFKTHTIAIARAFLEGQHPEDAVDYLLKFIGKTPAPPAGDNSPLAQKVRLQLGDVYNLLGSITYRMKDFDKAATYFGNAAANSPKLLVAQVGKGESLTQAKRYDEALEHFEKIWKLKPGLPPAANGLAWLLATHPTQAKRDGKRAQQLAELACKSSRYQKPEPLDALGAAFADQGDFKNALKWARKALQEAQRLRLQELAGKIQHRIELYQSGQAFRSPQ